MGQSRTLVVGFGLLLLIASSGCELVADFDRSKIPVEKVDAGRLASDAGAKDDTDAGSD